MFQILEKLALPIVLLIVPLIWTQWQNERLRKKNESLESEIKDLSIGVQIDLEIFNQIKEITESLATKTNIDRFLILTATNGKDDMRFVNAVYEHHKNNPKVLLSIGATGKYLKFATDSHSKQLLKDVEHYGSVFLDVSKMPQSDLKDIYIVEEINYSKVFFLMRCKINESDDRLFYCSCSTHSNLNFDTKDNIVMKQEIDKMREVFKELNNNNYG